ncbi:phospholipase effector Tle1 domain-containing protein [Methylobacterium komagatae]|uniref:Phospholipase effector Tle1 domain-containing protein n=1 Tax=Methylobacterium komagatae TaxID=374425 RepID=A0ABW2BP51_9HYPH
MTNIIVIIDGTTNSAARGKRQYFTNAFCIAEACILGGRSVGDEPVVLYYPGPANRDVYGKVLNAATGAEMEALVREVYLALCLNLNSMEHDKIYIFGYSRGAIVAKALISMIDASGILQRSQIEYLDRAYQYYMNRLDIDRLFLVDRIRKMPIEFVGLYDPVMGPENYRISIRIDDNVSSLVRHAVEIFALNERRDSFIPNIWFASNSNYDPFQSIAEEDSINLPVNLEQIWVPGCHGDVADFTTNSLITDIVLLTMFQRIRLRSQLVICQSYIDSVFKRTISQSRKPSIYDKSKLGWRADRLIPQNGISEIHPLCLQFENNYIIRNGSKKMYSLGPSADANNGSFFKEFDFSLNGIVTSTNPTPEADIAMSVQNALNSV